VNPVAGCWRIRAPRTATFVHVARLPGKITLSHRMVSIVFMTGAFLQVLLLRRLYTALYASRAVSGFPLRQLLIYLALANVQAWILTTPVSREMHHRIRHGLVVFDLTRPVGFISQMAARQVGITAAQLGFMTVPITALLAAGWLAAPHGVYALGEYVVALLLAFWITLTLTLIVGLIAFWTTEVESLGLLVTLIGQFFAGALIPVSMFPPLLRRIAEVLPFQGTGYLPVAIYVGQLRGAAALRAVLLQAGWCLLLGLAALVVWSKARHRIAAQGG
jgi:ABC-2 type transport system permease protein